MSTTQTDENPSPGACTEREVTVNTQRFRFIPRVVERKLAVDKRQTGTTVVISYQPVPQTQQDGNRCLVTPMQQTAKRPIAERCLIEPKRVPVPKKKRRCGGGGFVCGARIHQQTVHRLPVQLTVVIGVHRPFGVLQIAVDHLGYARTDET
uniref:Uncharacterized protein n=1 Tax=Anopheles coluzzii TaxID=1518534 RepID=A0A8W7P3I6_ANOCL